MKSDSKKQNYKPAAENKKTRMCKLACIAGLSLYLFLLLMDKNPQSFSYSIILFLYIYTILTMFSLTVFKQYMN